MLHLSKINRKLKKKTKIPGVDPEYLQRERASLIRKNRQVIYLNDKEMSAISEYCSRFNVHTGRSELYRKVIMEKILRELDENHPTLF